MKVLITILFLFSFCSSAALYAQQSPWELRENREGISVYTRKVTTSPILEYKANVIVNAPISGAIRLFENEGLISHWYYQCVHSELVENEGINQKIIYLILHFPWPVAARDIVFRSTRSPDPANRVISFSLTALPDRLPRGKGMIRVPFIKALWVFKPLSQGQTEVFFQQYSDPGGSIPAFMVNQIALDTPYYTLKNFRRLVTGKGV